MDEARGARSIPGGAARILVVDDDERNVRLLDAVLTAAGHGTVLARSGPECLSKVGESKPDLILLDVMMPGMSGLEVCRLLKQASETRDIPVVMVTALSDRQDHANAVEAGADDFITKPVDKSELLLRLRSLLRIKKYADDNRALEGLKRDLIRMIVHDLNNPLGVVSIALDFALENIQLRDPDFNQSLLDARDACRDARHLVSDMLELAKLERAGFEPKSEAVDLLPMLKDVARLQGVSAAVSITVSAPERLPAVFADPVLTKRIITNLVENAVRHSPEHSTVTLSASSREGSLEVAVRDRGHGIAPELHAAIFEKFRQIESDSARVGRLGLGLAFCKLAVEAQQGAIWVESSGQDDGASFNFTLPIARATP